MTSHYPATKHQAESPDDDNDKVEVSPALLPGRDTETQADQSKWDDQPIAPAKQRNEGEDAEEQRNGADEERKKVQHRRMMRADRLARNRCL